MKKLSPMLDLLEKIRSQMQSQAQWREENGHPAGQITRWTGYMEKAIAQAYNIAREKDSAELRAQILEIESAKLREYLSTIGVNYKVVLQIPESFYAGLSEKQQVQYYWNHHRLDLDAMCYMQQQKISDTLNNLIRLKKATV